MRCGGMLLTFALTLGFIQSAAASRWLLQTPAPILKQAFPKLETAIEQVKRFDFKSAVQNDEYLKVMFAPAFGGLDKNSVKLLSEYVKVMIAGVTREVAKQPVSGRDFDTMMSKLSQNFLIQKANGTRIMRTDRYITEDTDWLTFDGVSTTYGDVKGVETWLNNFVGDANITLESGVDMNVLIKIIVAASTIADNLLSGFVDEATEEKPILDVAVLRYPDANLPYFQFWRLQLSAFVQSERFVVMQTDKFGLSGEFQIATFEPRQSIIDQLSQTIRTQAASEADALFD